MNPTRARVLLGAGFVLALAVAFFAGRGGTPPSPTAGPPPAVVLAVRDLARLDATSFHIEKVIEVSDAQSRLWGLVQAKDAVLLVAVGDVVAGVDLGKLKDGDVAVDAATHAVTLHLPPADIASTTLDERATHVYARTTDLLAARNERLEGEARLRAEDAMRRAALDAGILDRAQASAEQTLRALLKSMGYDHVAIDWSGRG
ncbi:MAG TPA: DUF4230 domain-containing protein [Polyangiaceae bacterium]|nr:DUF4230 domain-containing protein [Polyangiaceae bacterium]